MTNNSLARTAQDEKLMLSGYGFTMEISANAKPVLFDAQGKEIVDAQKHIEAQKTLMTPVIQTLSAAWKKEMEMLQQASAMITNLSAPFEYAFTLQPKIGQLMQDGAVYAGISPDTETKMFVMPHDSGTMSWDNALKFTQELSDQYGYNGSKFDPDGYTYRGPLCGYGLDDGGWRLPTHDELKQLAENRDDIGNFNSDSPWYWSITQSKCHHTSFKGVQNLINGKDGLTKGSINSVRYVRTEPSLKP